MCVRDYLEEKKNEEKIKYKHMCVAYYLGNDNYM